MAETLPVILLTAVYIKNSNLSTNMALVICEPRCIFQACVLVYSRQKEKIVPEIQV